LSDAWIQIIGPEDAEGQLAEVYEWQSKGLGYVAPLTTIGSLAPELVHARLNLYRAGEQCPSPNITPLFRQYVSYLVSVLNAGAYCRSGSEYRLLDGGVSADDLKKICEGRYDEFSPQLAEMLRYVHKLAVEPANMVEEDVQKLRAVGFSDLDILDINNHCAHCSYTNRITLGLGLLDEIEEAPWSAIPDAAMTRGTETSTEASADTQPVG
jgi:uncharacterized peroxidase-related enzyme